MKYTIFIIIALIFFISCNNNTEKSDKPKNGNIKERTCDVLNIPDTIIKKFNNDEIRRSNIKKRMKLSDDQVKMLSNLDVPGDNEEMFLYGIEKIYDDVFALFILVKGVSVERFYMVTVDCLTKKLDDMFLTECDYFDVIEQEQNSETGLFISKYFKILNDSTISVRSITKKETKRLDDGKILKSQIDSLSFNYFVNRNGDIKLLNKDSVRIEPIN